MARVLFYTAIAMLTVSAALLYLPTYFSFIIAVLLLIGFIVLAVFYKRIKFNGIKTLTIILLIFTVLGILTHLFRIEPSENLAGHNAEITGTVCEHPERYTNYSVYIIKTEKITPIYEDGKSELTYVPQNIKIRLSDVNKIGAKIFDKLTLTVQFNDLDIYRTSSLANKTYAGGYVLSLNEHLGQNRPFYAPFYDLRDFINNLLYDNLDYQDASVVSAVLLGDKNNLDEEFEDNSRIAGTTHILVVSGMHLSIIFQLLSRIFSVLKIKKGIAELLMLFAIFGLTALCAFSPSVLRASLTYVILVIGGIIFKRPDPLNSLGAATVIILFFNPLGFGNLSLLLSVLSTFGLLYFCPIFERNLINIISKLYNPGKITKAISFSLAQTLSATVATMPVCILGIGYISLVAPLTNILIEYASSLLTTISFLAVILLCLPGVLSASATVPLISLSLLVRYTVKVTDICAAIPNATIPALPEYLISLFLGLAVIPIVAIANFIKTKNLYRIILKITACVLVILSISSAFLFYGISPKNEIAVPDVGNGTCVMIKTNSTVFAIGSGDSPADYNKIKSHLFQLCEKEIDYIILPAADKNFSAGAPEMIYNNKKAKVIYPNTGDYSERIEYISNKNFKSYSGTISFTNNGTEFITVKNTGTVVNFNNRSIIVYTGNGNFNKLISLCKTPSPLLICTNNLDFEINEPLSDCIITGSDQAKKTISEQLNTQNISHQIINTKTIRIRF